MSSVAHKTSRNNTSQAQARPAKRTRMTTSMVVDPTRCSQRLRDKIKEPMTPAQRMLYDWRSGNIGFNHYKPYDLMFLVIDRIEHLSKGLGTEYKGFAGNELKYHKMLLSKSRLTKEFTLKAQRQLGTLEITLFFDDKNRYLTMLDLKSAQVKYMGNVIFELKLSRSSRMNSVNNANSSKSANALADLLGKVVVVKERNNASRFIVEKTLADLYEHGRLSVLILELFRVFKCAARIEDLFDANGMYTGKDFTLKATLEAPPQTGVTMTRLDAIQSAEFAYVLLADLVKLEGVTRDGVEIYNNEQPTKIQKKVLTYTETKTPKQVTKNSRSNAASRTTRNSSDHSCVTTPIVTGIYSDALSTTGSPLQSKFPAVSIHVTDDNERMTFDVSQDTRNFLLSQNMINADHNVLVYDLFARFNEDSFQKAYEAQSDAVVIEITKLYHIARKLNALSDELGMISLTSGQAGGKQRNGNRGKVAHAMKGGTMNNLEQLPKDVLNQKVFVHLDNESLRGLLGIKNKDIYNEIVGLLQRRYDKLIRILSSQDDIMFYKDEDDVGVIYKCIRNSGNIMYYSFTPGLVEVPGELGIVSHSRISEEENKTTEVLEQALSSHASKRVFENRFLGLVQSVGKYVTALIQNESFDSSDIECLQKMKSLMEEIYGTSIRSTT